MPHPWCSGAGDNYVVVAARVEGGILVAIDGRARAPPRHRERLPHLHERGPNEEIRVRPAWGYHLYRYKVPTEEEEEDVCPAEEGVVYTLPAEGG